MVATYQSIAEDVAGIRDLAAERMVLCGTLLAADLNLVPLIKLGVTAHTFSDYRHQVVWCAILALAFEDRVGPYSVYLHLKATGKLADVDCGSYPHVGAAGWLLELCDLDPTGAWAIPAAHELLATATRRAAAHRAMELLRDTLTPCREPEFYKRLVSEQQIEKVR